MGHPAVGLNVGRLLGKQFFFLVFFLDLLKSLIPMAIASWIVSRIPEADRGWHLYLTWLLVGFAAGGGGMSSSEVRGRAGIASLAYLGSRSSRIAKS